MTTGRLIVFSGPPCSGKSTVGRLLAARHSLEHFEMDWFRVRLLPDSLHTRADRAVAYRAMHVCAELLLKRGETVIVNAGYSHDPERAEARSIAAALGAARYWVEFTVPAEVAVARNEARRSSHPGLDLTPEHVRELVDSFPYTRQGLTIDSLLSEAGCAAAIERYAGL